MNNKAGSYRVLDFPPERRVMLNALDLPRPAHSMYGLLEVDVTVPRQLITRHKALTGESLSFSGYLSYCLARAVDEDRTVQAYLKGRKKLVLFDEVSVGLMVERKTGEKAGVMGYVVKDANRKTCLDIQREIREAQAAPLPPHAGLPGWFRALMLLPRPVTKLFGAALAFTVGRNPSIFVALNGTVGLTSVGMFGRNHSGWGIYPAFHSLDLLVGSIAAKPGLVEGRVEPREILNLTVTFNHDVIDGAPAARFIARLVELIESGAGLEEASTDTAPGPALRSR